MTDYEFSEEPPRNDVGYPLHPEKGYPICAAQKSDRTTPTDHGRERDDIDYCLQRAGWGTDRDIGPCRNHPVTGEQWGESNPNFKHGATSEYFKSKLSDRQQRVFDEWVDALDDPEEAVNLLGIVGMNLALRGEDAMDPALIREGRQLLSEFNVVPNEDEISMQAEVDQTTQHELGDDEKELALEVIRQRQQKDAGGD
jgi:hypothetical protein